MNQIAEMAAWLLVAWALTSNPNFGMVMLLRLEGHVAEANPILRMRYIRHALHVI